MWRTTPPVPVQGRMGMSALCATMEEATLSPRAHMALLEGPKNIGSWLARAGANYSSQLLNEQEKPILKVHRLIDHITTTVYKTAEGTACQEEKKKTAEKAVEVLNLKIQKSTAIQSTPWQQSLWPTLSATKLDSKNWLLKISLWICSIFNLINVKAKLSINLTVCSAKKSTQNSIVALASGWAPIVLKLEATS